MNVTVAVGDPAKRNNNRIGHVHDIRQPGDPIKPSRIVTNRIAIGFAHPAGDPAAMFGKSRTHMRDNQIIRNDIKEGHDNPAGECHQALILEVIDDVVKPDDGDKVHQTDNHPGNVLLLRFF